MMIGSTRVSKDHWYGVGGLSNRRCWRRQSPSGGWKYYMMDW